jgi:hypothetical protein
VKRLCLPDIEWLYELLDRLRDQVEMSVHPTDNQLMLNCNDQQSFVNGPSRLR